MLCITFVLLFECFATKGLDWTTMKGPSNHQVGSIRQQGSQRKVHLTAKEGSIRPPRRVHLATKEDAIPKEGSSTKEA